MCPHTHPVRRPIAADCPISLVDADGLGKGPYEGTQSFWSSAGVSGNFRGRAASAIVGCSLTMGGPVRHAEVRMNEPVRTHEGKAEVDGRAARSSIRSLFDRPAPAGAAVVGVLPGEGIGPEVIDASLTVLRAV